MLPVRGHARGRAGVRREAPAALAGTLSRDRLVWWSYAVLAAFAFVLNGFGPVVLDIRDELGLSRTVAGLHSTGLAVGVLVAGVVGERLRLVAGWAGVLWTGAAGLLAGVLLLAVGASVVVTIAGALLIGLAGTLLLTMVPGVLSAHLGDTSAAAVSEAHATASLVSVVAPLTVGASLAVFGAWLPAFAVVVVVVLPALVLRRPALPEPPPPAAAASDPAGAISPAPPAPTTARLPRGYWRWWLALLFAVATEFSVLLWAADDAEHRLGLSASAAAVAPAAFLLGMGTARGLGARLLLGERTDRVFRLAACWGIAAFVLYRLVDVPAVALVGAALVGTGVGLLYPAALGLSMQAAPALAARASTRSALASGLAIGAGPLALGALADAHGIDRASWIAPLFLVVALAAAGRPAVFGRSAAG